MTPPNLADAPSAAMTPRFHSEHHRRRVGEPDRSGEVLNRECTPINANGSGFAPTPTGAFFMSAPKHAAIRAHPRPFAVHNSPDRRRRPPTRLWEVFLTTDVTDSTDGRDILSVSSAPSVVNPLAQIGPEPLR